MEVTKLSVVVAAKTPIAKAAMSVSFTKPFFIFVPRENVTLSKETMTVGGGLRAIIMRDKLPHRPVYELKQYFAVVTGQLEMRSEIQSDDTPHGLLWWARQGSNLRTIPREGNIIRLPGSTHWRFTIWKNRELCWKITDAINDRVNDRANFLLAFYLRVESAHKGMRLSEQIDLPESDKPKHQHEHNPFYRCFVMRGEIDVCESDSAEND
jgi:hypothetical protein